MTWMVKGKGVTSAAGASRVVQAAGKSNADAVATTRGPFR